mmetsp:Transcript_68030/g.107040  ORF Transcript_68030/g.107040 Transcript_68030/m.107040 type:complete len:159 (-) Transcript_68030:174-650(-)
MKPAWDQLIEEYKDNPEVLVADVDCTGAGKDLCSTHGIQGFPTIKWGNPNDLDDYNGGRGFDDLSKFAHANIGKQNLVEGSATDKVVKSIKKFMSRNVYPTFDNVGLIFSRVPDAAILVTIVSLLVGISMGIPIGAVFFGSSTPPPKKQKPKDEKKVE